MCGDHLEKVEDYDKGVGSPPHVRGPLHPIVNLVFLAGITPACAGTTAIVLRLFIPPWDHPRMCGDHFTGSGSFNSRLGSPPHVRGPL